MLPQPTCEGTGSDLLQLSDVSKSFDRRQVLRGITLEVEAGSILAIMGSSGGGKTTLLRCISGLLTPSSSSITLAGINVQSQPEEARQCMGMVFQSAALFDSLNVTDNVVFGIERRLKMSRSERSQVASAALAKVGMEPARSDQDAG